MDRHEPYETDQDDWFAEPEPGRGGEDDWPSAPGASARPPLATHETVEDDWLLPSELEAGRRRGLGPSGGDRRFLAAAAAALVVALLIGLAAAGVFSGSSSPSTTTTNTATTTQQSSPSTTAPSSSVQAPSTTLSPGDNGPGVKKLQRALASLGFSPGAIDGDYGPATKTALSDFQRAHGLAQDGILGPKTLAALKQALASGG